MKKWIQSAIKKPGALRQTLGIKAGKTIPMAKLEKAATSPKTSATTKRRANLAMTLRKMK